MEAKQARPICPKCKKGVLDTRVKRQFLVKLVFGWADVKRYRCHTCNRKSYIWNNTQAVQQA